MRSFKNYEPKTATTERNGGEAANGREWGNETESAEELVRRVAAQYEGKSSMDMMKGILAEAEKAKREGRLSNTQLDEFYAQFSPILGEFQKRKLKEIIEGLKKI